MHNGRVEEVPMTWSGLLFFQTFNNWTRFISIRILFICLLYGIGTTRMVMSIEEPDLITAGKVVILAYGFCFSGMIMHSMSFHK